MTTTPNAKPKPSFECSFERSSRSILFTGHRFGSPIKGDQRVTIKESILKTCLKQIMGSLESVYPDTKLRLLVGASDGTDELSLRLAKEKGWESIVIAPCLIEGKTPPKGVTPGEETKHIYVNKIICEDKDIPKDWFRIADENKLHYADLVVAVWDGESPAGPSSGGGSVRLIREALRRGIPVIWVNSHSGKVSFSHLERVNETVVARMDAHDMDVSWRDFVFGEGYLIEPLKIPNEIKKMLGIAWANESSSTLDDLNTWDLWEQKKKKKVVAGFVLRLFLRLFNYKNSKSITPIFRPVSAYQGIETLESDTNRSETKNYWSLFDRFDRAATYAASRYRDNIISLFLLSSLAVFCAVAGAIGLAGQNAIWGVAEIFALLLIGVILYNDKGKQCHKNWLLFRQTAELLRLNYFLNNQLASLTSTHQNVVSYQTEKEKKTTKMSVERPANWLFQQYVREIGPTQCRGDFSLNKKGMEYIPSFKAYLSSQIEYYKSDSEKNGLLNHNLHLTTTWMFGLVIGAVILHVLAIGVHFVEHNWHWVLVNWLAASAHWIHDQKWLLLVTASIPALAAALHSIKTTLEFERLQSSSAQQEQKLKNILKAIEDLEKSSADEKHLIFRGLVIKAAETMSEEHEAWAKLIKFQKVAPPA